MASDAASRIPDRAPVQPEDPDFRVAEVGQAAFEALQMDAENRGFATRWSSVEAMRRAVGPSAAYLRTFLRERRHGEVRSYRCLVMFSRPDANGGLTTFDVAPERLEALPSLALNAEARVAVCRMFALAIDGLFVTKD